MHLTILTKITEGYGARLAFSPEGGHWISASPTALHLWANDTMLSSAPFNGVPAGAAQFDAEGRRIFVALSVFDVERRGFVPMPASDSALSAGLPPDAHARPEEFEALGAAWSADGASLAVCARHRPPRRRDAVSAYDGPEQRVLLFDGKSLDLQHVLYEGSLADEYRRLAFGGSLLAAGARDIRFWQAAGGQAKGTLQAHTMALCDLRFSPDGAQAVSADWSGRVIVWDVERLAPRSDWKAHKKAAQCAVFAPRSGQVATGGDDGFLRLWDASGAQAEQLAALNLRGPVEGIAFHPGGSQLIAAVGTGTLVRCEVRD